MTINDTIKNILAPAVAIVRPVVVKTPSVRTYYLGVNGRVSQRKRLVGEVLATVRAYSTDHARFRFDDARQNRALPISVPKPFIGEAVLCKCGWHHAKHSECTVCANWKGLAGSVQTAPERQQVVA
jgi:hypothetical protein